MSQVLSLLVPHRNLLGEGGYFPYLNEIVPSNSFKVGLGIDHDGQKIWDYSQISEIHRTGNGLSVARFMNL